MAEYIEQEKAYELASDFAGQASTKAEYSAYWKVARAINELPTADVVEVRHGEWIAVSSSDMSTGKAFKCSKCQKMRYGVRLPPYCQECGAKMDGDTK